MNIVLPVGIMIRVVGIIIDKYDIFCVMFVDSGF
jgi:hypothetical protein